MKIILSLFLLFNILFCTAQIKSAKLQASGLTCAMCSRAVYKALMQIPSVDKIDVNIQSSTYSINFKKGVDVNPDDLSKAVMAAGFSISNLSLICNFSSMAIENGSQVQLNNKSFHFLIPQKHLINGDTQITLIDKSFLTQKEFKKYTQSNQLNCLQSGLKSDKVSREYHVTII
ncbi:MAG: heavy metal-associated domain-containing protein [Bacteroidota bacterium]